MLHKKMKMLNLLFKGTKVPENRWGISHHGLKAVAIKLFNHSTSLAGASLTGPSGWLRQQPVVA